MACKKYDLKRLMIDFFNKKAYFNKLKLDSL